MAGAETDSKLSLLAGCSARVVTAAATFVASVGVVVMGASGESFASEESAGSWLVLIVVPLTAVVAWFAGHLRYGAVMLACAVVGIIPWTREWWYKDATHVAGSGVAFATVGVLLTSFVSANSRPALRFAWEQCAPASAAAAGWLLTLSLLLIAVVDDWRWFGPLPLLFGTTLFLALALHSAATAKQRVARGAVPSDYMGGRSFRSVLLLEFVGGAAYVLVAISISVPSAGLIWLLSGGSMYQRSGTELFSDDFGKRPVPEK